MVWYNTGGVVIEGTAQVGMKAISSCPPVKTRLPGTVAAISRVHSLARGQEETVEQLLQSFLVGQACAWLTLAGEGQGGKGLP